MTIPTRCENEMRGKIVHRGFTLVEILVAMTVGLFLTAGILTLFLGAKQSYRGTEAVGAVQENGRYVLEQLGQELRQAGVLGCQRTLMLQETLPAAGSSKRLMHGFADDSYTIYNALALVDPINSNPDTTQEAVDWWLYNLTEEAPIEGFEGTGSAFAASSAPDFISISNLFTALGIDSALPAYDVITSRRAVGRPIPIIQHDVDATSPPLVVLGAYANDLQIGDIAVASTCEHATVFQVTDIVQDSPCSGLATIEFKPLSSSHADYAPPGNQDYASAPDPTANVSLGGRYANDVDISAACSTTDKSDLIPDTIGAVYSLRVTLYYVANNDDGIPALYRKVNGETPQELVSGVYGLEVLYGANSLAASCATDNDPDLGNYKPADEVVNWNEVNAAKISLLLGSSDDGLSNIVDTPMSLPFPEAGGGSGVFDASSLSSTDQRRLFQVFTSTVFLRNKLPCLGVDQWTKPPSSEI